MLLIHVVFDGVGVDASDHKIQDSISKLIRRKLGAGDTCECGSPHLTVRVGGQWRTGDFEVEEIASCCMTALAEANRILIDPPEPKTAAHGFSRSAIRSSQRRLAVPFGVG